MGLFGKKEQVEKKGDSVPSLPELPKLPSFSDVSKSEEKENTLPQLPSFPKNNLGEKFSQNIIKEAVNGKKEEREEISEEDDFVPSRQMIPNSPAQEDNYSFERKPEKREVSREIPFVRENTSRVSREIPRGFEDAGRMIRDMEPIFVRIDKFEESKAIFKRTKEQIASIERALNKIKEIKEEEDKELASWQQEILEIKDKISKVEREIFSKT